MPELERGLVGVFDKMPYEDLVKIYNGLCEELKSIDPRLPAAFRLKE